MDELVKKKIENMMFTEHYNVQEIYEQQRNSLTSTPTPRRDGFKKISETPEYKKWRAAYDLKQAKIDSYKKENNITSRTIPAQESIRINSEVETETGINIVKDWSFETYFLSFKKDNINDISSGDGIKKVVYSGYINNGVNLTPEQQVERISAIRSHIIDNSDIEQDPEVKIDPHTFEVKENDEPTLVIENDFLSNMLAEDLKTRLKDSERHLALERERYRLYQATKKPGDLAKAFNQPKKYKSKRIGSEKDLPDLAS